MQETTFSDMQCNNSDTIFKTFPFLLKFTRLECQWNVPLHNFIITNVGCQGNTILGKFS